jgi:hypothetical protein
MVSCPPHEIPVEEVREPVLEVPQLLGAALGDQPVQGDCLLLAGEAGKCGHQALQPGGKSTLPCHPAF